MSTTTAELWVSHLAGHSLEVLALVGGASMISWALSDRPAVWRYRLWAGTVALSAASVLLPTRMFVELPPGVASDLVAAWAVGALVLHARIGVAFARLLLLDRTRGPQLEPDVWIAAVDSPLTHAAARHVLVPPDFPRWDPHEQVATLAHERAHLRSGHPIAALSAWSICAVFWFHPSFWWARRRLLLEAEAVADDAALATGVPAADYATFLLNLAAGCPAGALGAGGPLAERVRRMLTPAPRRHGHTPWILATALIAVGVTFAGRAETTPAPQHCNAADTEIPDIDGRIPRTLDANRRLADHIRSLPPAELADVRAAAHELVTTCPYHRASAALPALLAYVVHSHGVLLYDPEFERLTPLGHGALRDLTHALNSHVELLAWLGLHPLPAVDATPDLTPWAIGPGRLPWVPGASAVLAAQLEEALAIVPDRVASYDELTRDRLKRHVETLNGPLADHWVPKAELIAYRSRLVELGGIARAKSTRANDELEPRLTALADDCTRWVTLLDVYMGQFC